MRYRIAMARDKKAEQDPLERQWFKAALTGGLPGLKKIFAEGVDINCLDQRGRTALFYAMAPYGGFPETVEWLLANGAAVNIRDKAGESLMEFGLSSVTSALENDLVGQSRRLLLQHGYRESAREVARRPKPPGPPPRRKLSDFWGRWTIDNGDHRGAEVRISGARIRSDLDWLEFEVREYELDEKWRLLLRGERSGQAVEATVKLHGDRVAVLSLKTGDESPLPEIRIKR